MPAIFSKGRLQGRGAHGRVREAGVLDPEAQREVGGLSADPRAGVFGYREPNGCECECECSEREHEICHALERGSGVTAHKQFRSRRRGFEGTCWMQRRRVDVCSIYS
jgi:hypothetical protein